MEYVLFSHPILQHIGHSKPGFGAVSSSFFRGRRRFIAGNNAPVCASAPAHRGRRACWGGRLCGGYRRSPRPGPFRWQAGSGGRGFAPGPRSPGGRLSAGVQRRIFSSRDWKPLITTRSVAQHASAQRRACSLTAGETACGAKTAIFRRSSSARFPV